MATDVGRPARPGPTALAGTCGHLLRLAHQRHAAIWAQEVGNEPTGAQYSLLEALDAAPGADQRTAGALASLDRSSTTDVVARLEARGWVRRAADPGDGRRDVLSLSPDAVAALPALRRQVAEVQDRLMRPVPAPDREPLLAGLGAVAGLGADTGRPPAALLIPGHLVRRAQQAHTTLFAEVVGRGLTGAQYAVLHVLGDRPAIDQRTLGAAAGLDRSTTTDLVRRLERRGLVARGRDPGDGRRRVLSLTDAGGELARWAGPRVEAVQQRLLAPLGGSAEDFVRRLLRLAGVSPAGHEPWHEDN